MNVRFPLASVSRLVPSNILGLSTLAVLLSSPSVEAGFQWPIKPPAPPRFELDKPSELPLQATKHYVEVVGPVAYVRVIQVYKNTGSRILDAQYIFPGSTRSAVSSLVMRVGERTIRAELKKKDEARKTFEEAKREGYRASLLEQQRPNMFSMALTNLRPNETVEVELGYTELLEPEEGQYELVLPGAIAERFGPESRDDHKELHRIQEAPLLSKASWTANVRIQDGLHISEVSSPTYSEIQPTVDAEGQVSVRVVSQGGKDFVLRWRVTTDRQAEAGLVSHEGKEEKFFMVTVAPPREVETSVAPPREVVFILDVSGSMRGYPLEVAKGVMKTSLEALRSEDRFNILFFAGGGWRFSDEPLRATAENVRTALAMVSKQQGGGGTQLVQALDSVASLPRAPGLARTVVVVTDGLVSFEKAAFAKVREKLQGATLFTLGIGFNVNRMLVEGLARAGGGASYVAFDRSTATVEAKRLSKAIRQPVLTDIQLKIEGLDAYDLEPPTIPDLYVDRPIVVVGKYRGPAKGRIRLQAQAGKRQIEQVLRVEEAMKSTTDAQVPGHPLQLLWARRKLQRVADDRALVDGGASEQTITQLGLRYGLLTDYTSFVAVDSEGGKIVGRKEVVNQPGPQPLTRAMPMAAMPGPSGGGAARLRARSVALHRPRMQAGREHARVTMPTRGKLGGVATSPQHSKEQRAEDLAQGAEVVEEEKVKVASPLMKPSVMAVEILPPLVSGELTSNEVKRVVQQQLPKLQELANKLLGTTTKVDTGRHITFGLKISPQGKVTEVTIISDGLKHASLRQAWRKVLTTLLFPAMKRVDLIRVPIVLKPAA